MRCKGKNVSERDKWNSITFLLLKFVLHMSLSPTITDIFHLEFFFLVSIVTRPTYFSLYTWTEPNADISSPLGAWCSSSLFNIFISTEFTHCVQLKTFFHKKTETYFSTSVVTVNVISFSIWTALFKCFHMQSLLSISFGKCSKFEAEMNLQFFSVVSLHSVLTFKLRCQLLSAFQF